MTTNLTAIPKVVRDIFLQGVYNETFSIMHNGGPECAEESTLEFKAWLNLRLVPWYIAGVYIFYRFVKTTDTRKTIKVYPSLVEKIMGLVCFY
jgi:hypothetical protein